MKKYNDKILMGDETAIGFGESTFLARAEKHKVNKIQEPIEVHWHTYYEFELVVEGCGTHTINNIEKPLKRGSAFLCLLTDFHTVRNDSDPLLILYNIKFNPRLLDKNIAAEIEKKKFHLHCNIESEDDIEKFISLFDIFYHILSKNQNESNLKNEFIIHTVNQIISFFLMECDHFSPSEQNLKTNEQKLQQAVFYIHQNFTKSISQADVAKQVQLTTPYFSAIFREKMGYKYSAYLTKLRLNYAKSLIERKKSDNVSELCQTVGFYSTSYFIKKFKEEFGITPKELIIKKR